MNQEKIGKFITEKRKENKLTQEQLAEQLNISKNAVSKWERGLNLPDVSIMQDLCKILNITLNELFIGEKILDDKYKEVADKNLLNVLENSSFTLKEKIDFYKKKWKKEHISKFIMCFIIFIILGIVLKFQNVEGYIIGAIEGMLSLLFYIFLYNQMMIYVENNVYKKFEKEKTYLINEDKVDEYTKQLEYQLKEKDKKITELENMLKPVLDLNIPINTLINEFERLNELEDNMEISKLKSKYKKV